MQSLSGSMSIRQLLWPARTVVLRSSCCWMITLMPLPSAPLLRCTNALHIVHTCLFIACFDDVMTLKRVGDARRAMPCVVNDCCKPCFALQTALLPYSYVDVLRSVNKIRVSPLHDMILMLFHLLMSNVHGFIGACIHILHIQNTISFCQFDPYACSSPSPRPFHLSFTIKIHKGSTAYFM